MANKIMEQLKGMSKEERIPFFKAHKSELAETVLHSVNGGTGNDAELIANPNSEECPFEGNWISSDGYVCNGEVVC
ncbi:MAG: hypothetical protein IKD66_02460 [Solobacterium sp.]|nr:hypothetical protein [Solobacterium sp.]